jgi:hypothetical protein
MPHRCKHDLQIRELKPQKKQMVSALNFNPTESTIGIPLKTPSNQAISSGEFVEDSHQRMKACLGMEKECQTKGHYQLTSSLFF